MATIDKAYFEKKYNEDKENQKLQTKEEYLEWVNKFYDGSFVADGWDKTTEKTLEKMKAPANKTKAKGELTALGKIIAGEWSKDNKVRKISTDNLKKWGNDLKAADSDDKILGTIAKIKSEASAKAK
jgi:hypothetical protein